MTLNTVVSIIGIIVCLVLILATVVILGFFTSADRAVLLGSSKKFEHAGTERYYRIHPAKNSPKRIIVGLHGFNDSARKFAYYSGLHNSVDNSTIIIYPEAAASDKNNVMRGWNAGFCCGSGYLGKLDDAGFIMGLVEQVRDEYEAHDIPLFIAGFSNGGFMTQKLAVDFPDKIAAVAVVSGSIGTEQKSLSPASPMPILLMHGEKDHIVPFGGGTGSSDPDFTWLPFSETKKRWEAVNLDAAPTKIKLYPNNGHSWDDWRIVSIWNKTPQASQDIFSFFAQQTN